MKMNKIFVVSNAIFLRFKSQKDHPTTMSAESVDTCHCNECGRLQSDVELQRCEYVKFVPNGRIERCVKTICEECSDFGGTCKQNNHHLQLDDYWSGRASSSPASEQSVQ